MKTSKAFTKLALQNVPFWLFLVLFKFGAGLHFELMSPYGEQVLPLRLVGILIGSASLIQLLLDIPVGKWLDRFGYRRLLKVTTFFFICAGVVLVFGLTQISYYMTLFFSILGWLFFGPGSNAYALSQAPKSQAGKFMSLESISHSAGIVLSCAFLAFALQLPVQYAGLMISGLLLLAFICLGFVKKDHISAHAEQKIDNQKPYLPRKQKSFGKIIKSLNPVLVVMMITNFSSTFFYAIIWFVVPLLIANHEGVYIQSRALGVFDFTVVVLGFFIGRLADTLNKKMLILMGLLIFAAAGVGIGYTFGGLFLLRGFLATFGDELSQISLRAWLDNIAPDHDNDGKISGLLNAASDLGWAVGPMIAGVCYEFLGPTYTIAIGGLMVFMGVLLYIILLIRHDKNGLNEIIQIATNKPHRLRSKK